MHSHRLDLWLLVLAAKRIPYHCIHHRKRPGVYVPALYEGLALHEIRSVEQERAIPNFVPPARNNVIGVLVFFGCLIFWHAFRWKMTLITPPTPPFPLDPAQWSAAFGLDVYRFRAMGEWWRSVTALTLHADDAHLLSNVGFGIIFFIPLCRRAGLGFGLFLATLAGISGNICNAFYKDAHVVSLGFSTALFGAMGSLCSLTSADVFGHYRRFIEKRLSRGLFLALGRRILVPFAAGLAFLGFLGGGGEARTDYAAHIYGFICGLLVTTACLPAERTIFSLGGKTQAQVQGILCVAVVLLYASAWLYVLHFRV